MVGVPTASAWEREDDGAAILHRAVVIAGPATATSPVMASIARLFSPRLIPMLQGE